MQERDCGLDIDQAYSERAREMLWTFIGGEEKVVEFVKAVEDAGGKLNMHGSAARTLEQGEEIIGDVRPFGDIDFVVTGVEGDELEAIVRDVMGDEWDVGARRHREEGSPIKTIELAKDGEQIADVVCARKNDKPDVTALMEDHLEGCFTPDGRLVAFEITKDEKDRIQLTKIVKEKEIKLDVENLRVDHVWLWYHALVTGKLPPDKEAEVQKMINKFMDTRGEQLVMWRKPDESKDEWMERRRKVQGVEPSRVKEVEIRSFGRCNVEFIVDKLNSALAANPEKFWEVGMETGILPAVFPALKMVSKNSELAEEVREAYEYVSKDYDVIWLYLLNPIMRELYKPTGEVLHGDKINLKVIDQHTANKFVGVEEGEDENADIRRELFQFYAMYQSQRLLKVLKKQRIEGNLGDNLDKVSREIVLILVEDPYKMYELVTSYLPLGGRRIKREIGEVARS